MWNEYAREKVAELERERRRRQAPVPAERRTSLLAAAARAFGACLRRVGEALERWAMRHNERRTPIADP